jgi:uncharacterized membrane protein
MNITALNNITSPTINNSLINNTSEIGTNLIQNANQQTQGYFGLGIMLIIFIFLMIILMNENEVFRFSFSSAFLISSGVSLLIGIILLISDMASSYQHVVWFSILFMIALIIKYYENP